MEERILDYGIVPIPQRRFYRRLLKAIVLIGIITGAAYLGPGAWRWGKYLYWQQQCLDYQAPARQVIFSSSDPPTLGVWSGTTCWPAMNFTSAGSGGGHTGIDAFVHALRRPDGKKCLVELEVTPVSANGEMRMEYYVWTVSPWPVAELVQQGYAFSTISTGLNWKIFSAQPDPANPSHFTFDYKLNGQRHTCDAWLNNSNQLVVSTRP